MAKFQFKGLIAPVFTPFTQDKKTIDYNVIEKYALYLKSHGTHGILVNGIIGEGTTLRIEEHKRLAEVWLGASRKQGLTMILAIGGVGIADVLELTKHAEVIGVDAIVLLPDLFYKPKIEEDMVEYVKEIVKYGSITRPIMYYHIPEYTNVHLNLIRLNNLMQKAVPNFTGTFYRHNDIEHAHNLLKEGHKIIMATDTILIGVLSLGFDAISSVSMNLFPENVTQIYEMVLNGKLREAADYNDKLYRRIKDVLGQETSVDWVGHMKLEFNKKSGINVGELRKPHITYDWYNKMH